MRKCLLVSVTVLLVGCGEERSFQSTTAPSFSQTGPSSVTATLARRIELDFGATIDTFTLADTTAYASFGEVFALLDDDVAVAGAIAGLNDSAFDGPEPGGYWNYVDSAGTLYELTLTSGIDEPWEQIAIQKDGQQTETYRWTWEEMSGGWLLDSAIAHYELATGTHAYFYSTRLSSVIAWRPETTRVSYAGVFPSVLLGTLLGPPILFPSFAVGGCSVEWAVFASLSTVAGLAVAKAALTKSPGDVIRAAVAVAGAAAAGVRLATCLRHTPPSLQQ